MLNTCEAINQCQAFPYNSGEVCGDEAEYQRNGHAVCWCHKERIDAGKEVTFEAVPCASAAE